MGLLVAQLLAGLANASALFLAAAGLSLIFGVTRVVNFAHGSFYMIGAYVGWTSMQLLPGAIGFWASVLLAGLGAGLVGLVVERIVLRPIYRAPELYQLVATFGVVLIVQDLALMIWGPEDLLGPRAPGLEGVVRILGEPVPQYDLALIALAPVVALALWRLIARTRTGILLRAATQDPEMAGALGIDRSLLFAGAFFLGTALAGLGGAAQLPKGGADLLMDFNILAPVFVVVVIGGMGSLPGAYLAAVLISVLNVFGVAFLPQSTLALMFGVMVAVLAIRPHGLLGREDAAAEHGRTGEPERPIRPVGPTARAAVGAGLVALAALPLAAPDFVLALVADVAVFCLFAASVHFLACLGGLVTFGHAAFFGGGAYVAALLVTHAGAPMGIALPLAPLGAGIAAVAIGWVCLRRSGVYFAMLTLASAQLLWSLVFQWSEFTGGDDGLVNIWPPEPLQGPAVFYWLATSVAVAGIIILLCAAHSPFGYALRAARDSERRAEASGIPVARARLAAFAFAGAMAGLAGGLFAYSKGSIFPHELEIARSFDGLVAAFLGGAKTLYGGVVGGAALIGVEDLVGRFEHWRLAFGLLIVATAILAPDGIAGSLRNLGERLGRQRDADPGR